MSELEHSAGVSRRRWLMLAKIGVGLVTLTLIVVALVIFDKEHFKELVGPAFLPIVGSGIFAGAILLVVAAWNLPERKNNNWRAFFLLIWGLVAITSPAFGYMFLFPFGLLALTLPVVISILITLSRATPA